MDFTGKTIAVAVSGGIASYRACDFIRELYRRGAARVVVLMTHSACGFVSPLTFQALSRESVHTDVLAVDERGVPVHITLAQEADALLILPATANILAKLANGLADDLVSTTALTFTGKPVLVSPAMNTRMWENPATRRNRAVLETFENVTVIPPVSGSLACGETGEGHLADSETILQCLYRAVHPNRQAFSGIRAMVTAGGTREPIDPVRGITNRSSGKMGIAIADELFAMGADVTLISTVPVSGRTYRVVRVETVTELQQAAIAESESMDWIVMAAAVSDYRVAEPATEKIKKNPDIPQWDLRLSQTDDILADLGQRKRPGQMVVGFAAESTNLHANASRKLVSKNLDAIVVNDISRSDIGFQVDDNEVTVLFADGGEKAFPKASKGVIARQLLLALLAQSEGREKHERVEHPSQPALW